MDDRTSPMLPCITHSKGEIVTRSCTGGPCTAHLNYIQHSKNRFCLHVYCSYASASMYSCDKGVSVLVWLQQYFGSLNCAQR